MGIKSNNLANSMFTEDAVSAGRGPSRAVWSHLPLLEYMTKSGTGQQYFNDFGNYYTLATNQAVTHLSDDVCGFTGSDAGDLITSVAGEKFGAINIAAAVSDKGSTAICMAGDGTGGLIELPVAKKFSFECRMKSSLAANDDGGIFVGIVDNGSATDAGIISDTGAMTDINYLGFHINQDDFDTINPIWKNKGVAASAEVAVGDATGVNAANTYTKLGIVGDGYQLRFYQDGALIYQTTNSVHAATAFPNVATENMCLAMAIHGHDTTAMALTVDWIKFAQEY